MVEQKRNASTSDFLINVGPSRAVLMSAEEQDSTNLSTHKDQGQKQRPSTQNALHFTMANATEMVSVSRDDWNMLRFRDHELLSSAMPKRLPKAHVLMYHHKDKGTPNVKRNIQTAPTSWNPVTGGVVPAIGLKDEDHVLELDINGVKTDKALGSNVTSTALPRLPQLPNHLKTYSHQVNARERLQDSQSFHPYQSSQTARALVSHGSIVPSVEPQRNILKIMSVLESTAKYVSLVSLHVALKNS